MKALWSIPLPGMFRQEHFDDRARSKQSGVGDGRGAIGNTAGTVVDQEVSGFQQLSESDSERASANK